jgi:hypothetical protein
MRGSRSGVVLKGWAGICSRAGWELIFPVMPADGLMGTGVLVGW